MNIYNPKIFDYVIKECDDIEPGKDFGKIEFFDNRTRISSVYCKERCELIYIEKIHYELYLK